MYMAAKAEAILIGPSLSALCVPNPLHVLRVQSAVRVQTANKWKEFSRATFRPAMIDSKLQSALALLSTSSHTFATRRRAHMVGLTNSASPSWYARTNIQNLHTDVLLFDLFEHDLFHISQVFDLKKL